MSLRIEACPIPLESLIHVLQTLLFLSYTPELTFPSQGHDSVHAQPQTLFTMVKCFAPNCKSGYKSNTEKVSMFKAPSDPTLLEQWQRAIPRKDRVLRSKDHVCEKHFKTTEVVKDWTAEQNGVVIMKVARRAKLLPQAVPTIFPGCPQYLSKHTQQRKRPAPRSFDTSIKVKARKQFEVQEPALLNVREMDESAAHIESAAAFSFKMLQENVMNIQLPNGAWNVHAIDKEVVAFVYIGLNCEHKHSVILKQVCFHGTLDAKIYVLNRLLEPQQLELSEEFAIGGLQDVEFLISNLHSKSVCLGGPKHSEYRNVIPETAYVDETGHWRHIRCQLFCDKKGQQPLAFQCRSCGSINNTLRKNVTKNMNISYPKRVRINAIPTHKARINIIRRAHAQTSKSLKRCHLQKKVLENRVKLLQEKLCTITELD